jgi:hypothetical protein
MRVVCSDGTWMAPSDVHVQTAGAWTESEMARTPGARADRQRWKRQQWRGAEARLQWLKADARL